MIDQIIRSMARGFGWRLGSRAAYKLPLVPAVVVLVLVWYVSHHI